MSQVESSVDELSVLFPHAQITIHGENITVHEYSLSQQLQHRKVIKSFTDSLGELFKSPEHSFTLDQLMDVMSEQSETVLDLLALSINKPRDFVSGLTGVESENLLMTWWGVNANFFTNAALRPLLEKMAKEMNQVPIGESSSKP